MDKMPSEYKTMAGVGFQEFAYSLDDYSWKLCGLQRGLDIPNFVFNACKKYADELIAARKQEIAAQQKTTAATAV